MLLVLVLFSLFGIILSHDSCTYFPPTEHEVVTNVDIAESSHKIHKRSVITEQKLRIFPYYDTTFNNQNDLEKKKEIVNDAINYWQSVLTPKPGSTSNNIKLNRFCKTNYVVYTNSTGKSVYFCKDGCASETSCGPVRVPNDHLGQCREYVNKQTIESGTAGPGISNSDYILYIAAATTSRCTGSSILGYAAHCQLEVNLDRPIAGYINFCPDRLSANLGQRTQSIFTARHEILHALGFAVSLYAYFRDSTGEPYTPRNSLTGRPDLGMFNADYNIRQWSNSIIINKTRTVTSVAGSFDKLVQLFIGTNALREARNHFNCPTLDGVELEDQGGVGVAVTHWEKRIMENDILTPTFTQEDRVSKITLGFLEDTGWYTVDYSKAGDFNWGKNLGCDFVTQSCYEYMKKKSSNNESIWPYCDRIYQPSFQTSCTVNKDSFGYCNLVKSTDLLDSRYRYFTSLKGVQSGAEGFYGGQVYLADYCPYIQEYSVKSGAGVVVRTTNCLESVSEQSGDKNVLGESYGSSSTCLNHQGTWTGVRCDTTVTPSIWGSGCYEIMCHNSYRVLIKVNTQTFQCLRDDAIIDVTSKGDNYLIRGSLICPKCSDKCSSAQCSADEIYPNNAAPLSNEEAPCSSVTCVDHTNLITPLFCCMFYYFVTAISM